MNNLKVGDIVRAGKNGTVGEVYAIRDNKITVKISGEKKISYLDYPDHDVVLVGAVLNELSPELNVQILDAKLKCLDLLYRYHVRIDNIALIWENIKEIKEIKLKLEEMQK